jgi:hypothetical protein
MKNNIFKVLLGCVFILFLFSIISIAGEIQTLDCGNNICEQIEFTLKPGEEQIIIANGNSHTFKLDHHSINGMDWLVIDGSEPLEGSLERNILMDEILEKSGFKFTRSTPNREEGSDETISTTYIIDEKNWCESDCTNEDISTLTLGPGWNLVYGFDFSRCDKLQPKKLCEDDILAKYMYFTPLKKYFKVYPNGEELTNEEIEIINSYDKEGYLRHTAWWIYTKEEKNIYFNVPSDYDIISEIKLIKGWNLVPITPDMIGKKLNEFKGNCEILKGFRYDASSASWVELEKFNQSDILLGFAVKVEDNCKLGTVVEEDSGIEEPPQIPSN